MEKNSTKTERSQREIFKDTARDLGCDEDEDRFNTTLKKIVPSKTEKGEKPTTD